MLRVTHSIFAWDNNERPVPELPAAVLGPSRRRVVFSGLGLLALAGTSTTAYAGFEAAENLVVTRYRLRPPPHGYNWVRVGDGFALVSPEGQIFDMVR